MEQGETGQDGAEQGRAATRLVSIQHEYIIYTIQRVEQVWLVLTCTTDYCIYVLFLASEGETQPQSLYVKDSATRISSLM